MSEIFLANISQANQKSCMRLRLLVEEWELEVIDKTEDDYPEESYFITYLAFDNATKHCIRVELTVPWNGIADIDWIGNGLNRHFSKEGFKRLGLSEQPPGPAAIRKLLLQIARENPTIRRFVGHRISGMRAGPLATAKAKPFRLPVSQR